MERSYKIQCLPGHAYGSGDIVPVFYGSRAHAVRMLPQDRIRGNGHFLLTEVPVRGKYADKIPLVEVVFADGTRESELVFEKAEVITVDHCETHSIMRKDKHYLLVVSYIRMLPDDIGIPWPRTSRQD